MKLCIVPVGPWRLFCVCFCVCVVGLLLLLLLLCVRGCVFYSMYNQLVLFESCTPTPSVVFFVKRSRLLKNVRFRNDRYYHYC